MGDRITLSAAESALVEQIFKKNDPQSFGVITGDVAVSVFGGSKLPSTVLGEIWGLADNDNKGFLDKQGVAVAIRLIGHAQAGRQVSEALLKQGTSISACEYKPVHTNIYYSRPSCNHRRIRGATCGRAFTTSQAAGPRARLASTYSSGQGKVHEAVH